MDNNKGINRLGTKFAQLLKETRRGPINVYNSEPEDEVDAVAGTRTNYILIK